MMDTPYGISYFPERIASSIGSVYTRVVASWFVAVSADALSSNGAKLSTVMVLATNVDMMFSTPLDINP